MSGRLDSLPKYGRVDTWEERLAAKHAELLSLEERLRDEQDRVDELKRALHCLRGTKGAGHRCGFGGAVMCPKCGSQRWHALWSWARAKSCFGSQEQVVECETCSWRWTR